MTPLPLSTGPLTALPNVTSACNSAPVVDCFLISDPLPYMLEVFDKIIAPSIHSPSNTLEQIRRSLYRRAFSECATQHISNLKDPLRNVEPIGDIIINVALQIGILIT